ncbi:MAG: hypothetical protein IAE90_07345 [Ignavibacteria bacterium]|nr:hypothetical protein [Ignavibacteria bacterium]
MIKYLLMWLVREGVYEIQSAYDDQGNELESALLFENIAELLQFVKEVCDETPFTMGVDVFAIPVQFENNKIIEIGNNISASEAADRQRA